MKEASSSSSLFFLLDPRSDSATAAAHWLCELQTSSELAWSRLCLHLDVLDWRHFLTHWPRCLETDSDQRSRQSFHAVRSLLPVTSGCPLRLTEIPPTHTKKRNSNGGGQLADILDSTQRMLSLELAAFSGSEMWHRTCWGVKTQPGILRVLHSRSVSLCFFLLALCWKSAAQTATHEAKGWF